MIIIIKLSSTYPNKKYRIKIQNKQQISSYLKDV